MLRVHWLDITGESGKREYGVKGKPSVASVIFNITAIYDGPPQVLRLKAES
jgi:hypothetical protein